MRSVKAVQQNNYHYDHDQSERLPSKGVGSRLKKLLKNNFNVNIFQDFQSHLQKKLYPRANFRRTSIFSCTYLSNCFSQNCLRNTLTIQFD